MKRLSVARNHRRCPWAIKLQIAARLQKLTCALRAISVRIPRQALLEIEI